MNTAIPKDFHFEIAINNINELGGENMGNQLTTPPIGDMSYLVIR